MRFCPQCGAPLLAGAKFCVECGRALDVAASGAGESGRARSVAAGGRNTITTTFVFVFVALAVFGLAAAAWIYVKTPEVVREQIATAPPSPGAPASGPGAAASNATAPEQNPAAGGNQGGGLPPGHPAVELPTEARSFIDKVEREANAKPKDVVAWNKFGAVSMRAAVTGATARWITWPMVAARSWLEFRAAPWPEPRAVPWPDVP